MEFRDREEELRRINYLAKKIKKRKKKEKKREAEQMIVFLGADKVL